MDRGRLPRSRPPVAAARSQLHRHAGAAHHQRADQAPLPGDGGPSVETGRARGTRAVAPRHSRQQVPRPSAALGPCRQGAADPDAATGSRRPLPCGSLPAWSIAAAIFLYRGVGPASHSGEALRWRTSSRTAGVCSCPRSSCGRASGPYNEKSAAPAIFIISRALSEAADLFHGRRPGSRLTPALAPTATPPPILTPAPAPAWYKCHV